MRAHADDSNRRDAVARVNTGKLSLESATAGVLGLIAMTLVLGLAPLVRAASVHLPQFYGYMAEGNLTVESAATPFVGWALYIAFGVLAAMAYGWLVERRQPRAPALTGALFALAPWLALHLVLDPIAGVGMFARHVHGGGAYVLETLVAFLAYGAVTGAFLRGLVRMSAQRMVEARR